GSIQYWTKHTYRFTFDPYARGEVGGTWAAVQLCLIAAFAFSSWLVASRQGSRSNLFWLITGGGALCLGVNEATRADLFWASWAAAYGSRTAESSRAHRLATAGSRS